MVQNEDCKYYYRDIVENDEKKWNNTTGRQNTLRTHISVISFLKGEISFSQLISKFTHGGVTPLAIREIEKVTGGLVKVE